MNKINPLIWPISILLLVLTIFSAHASDIYTPDHNNITALCQIDDNPCSGSAECNITITDKYGDSISDLSPMLIINNTARYTLPNISYGRYDAIIYCLDQGFSSSTTYTFYYERKDDIFSGSRIADNYVLLIIIICIMLFMFIMAFRYRMALIGILGSIMLAFLGFGMAQLSFILGSIFIGLAVVSFAYFIFN